MKDRLQIMISSRCKDEFPLGSKVLLTDIRRKLKAELQAENVFGTKLYEVWINEDQTSLEGSKDATEHCIAQAQKCDLFIALYNGHSGWVGDGGTLGICHRELQEAYNSSPRKVYGVSLLPYSMEAVGLVHEQFREYVKRLNLFRGDVETDEDGLINHVKRTVGAATVDLMKFGSRGTSRSSPHLGEALNWDRLSLEDRKLKMEETFREALAEQFGCEVDENRAVAKIGDNRVLMVPHGVPGTLGQSRTREMVGQPALKDHLLVDAMHLLDADGPIHIVLCQKPVTEVQAQRMLGFPDAMIVSPPFGVYLADPVQKIQIIFLAKCRDPSSTRNQLQEMFEWLNRSGETAHLAMRSNQRRRVVETLADVSTENTSTQLGGTASTSESSERQRMLSAAIEQGNTMPPDQDGSLS